MHLGILMKMYQTLESRLFHIMKCGMERSLFFD